MYTVYLKNIFGIAIYKYEFLWYNRLVNRGKVDIHASMPTGINGLPYLL